MDRGREGKNTVNKGIEKQNGILYYCIRKGYLMQLTQLEYLIAVEKYGSISRAAREMYTSQSSISTSIKNLETELGVELLRRGPKGVNITEEGRYILESAKIINRHMEDIKSVRRKIDGQIKGNVVAGGEGYCCMNILGNTAMALKERYPEIQVTLKGSNQRQIFSDLSDGAMDMGVFQINKFTSKYVRAKIENKHLACWDILKSHLVVGVSRSHPLYGRDKVTVEDLIPYEIVTGFARAEDLIYWSLFCEMQKRGYTRPITCLGDVGVSRLYAIKRNCIQLVPKVSLDMTNHLFSTPLYPIEIDQYYELNYLLVHREEAFGEAQEIFLDEVLKYLESCQDEE